MNDCWIWTRTKDKDGYGYFMKNYKNIKAHRFYYAMYKGPIPQGYVIDHLCRTPSCVNPDHLEAVTHRENTMRGNSKQAKWAKRTHCDKGHAYSGDNLILKQGGRYCRICRDNYNKQYWNKRKEVMAKST